MARAGFAAELQDGALLMPREFEIVSSPRRPEYLRYQSLDQQTGLTINRKLYATTQKPASFPAEEAGIFDDLLLETGDFLLLEDGSSHLVLEASSSSITSLIYLFSALNPVLYAGVSEGKSSGSDAEDLSLVFPKGFFSPGDVMVYQARGAITENAVNTSLAFTLTFPDTSTSTSVSMPQTVTLNALSDWTLDLKSVFGYNSSNQGTVQHTGVLTVANTDDASGQSTSLLAALENTFAYESILYYKPQVAWNTQNANSTVEFYNAVLQLN